MSTQQDKRGALWLQVAIEAAKLKLSLDDKAGRPHDPADVRLANFKRPTAKTV